MGSKCKGVLLTCLHNSLLIITGNLTSEDVEKPGKGSNHSGEKTSVHCDNVISLVLGALVPPVTIRACDLGLVLSLSEL